MESRALKRAFGRARLLLATGLLTGLVACGGGGGGAAGTAPASGGNSNPPTSTSPAPANRAPLASASGGSNVQEGDTVRLDASQSSDPDGDTLRYRWSFQERPEGSAATLDGAESKQPSFVADKGGKYRIALVVSDGTLESSTTLELKANRQPKAAIKGPLGVLSGQTFALDGSASSDPDGDSLSYTWTLSQKPDGSKASLDASTGDRVSLTPDIMGNYCFYLQVSDPNSGGRLSLPASHCVRLEERPLAKITAPASASSSTEVQLNGFFSFAEWGGIGGYTWRVVSAPARSEARIILPTSMRARLWVDLPGAYTVELVVKDMQGIYSLPVTTTIQVTASSQRPTTPVITLPVEPIMATQEVSLRVSALDPGNGTVSYVWRFADGTTGTGATLSRRFATPGQYAVTVTATNGLGLSSTVTTVVRVAEALTGGPLPACMGSRCGASSATRYSGSGVGIWTINNTSLHDQVLDLDIDNVGPGRSVVLLFANAGEQDSIPLPAYGIAPAPGATNAPQRTPAQAALPARTAIESVLVHRYHESTAKTYLASRQARAIPAETRRRASSSSSGGKPRPAPPLHSTREWTGALGEKVPYQTQVEASCQLANGRNIVFWIDSAGLLAGQIKLSQIDAMREFACGSDGAFARLTAIAGDFWGPHQDSTLISDDTLQDVNVVIGYPKEPIGAGGYYWIDAMRTKATNPNSNEAVALFLNMRDFANSTRHYLHSVLIHEATHTINGYQRLARRGVWHESWLEETSAMMGEDLVASALLKDEQGQPYSNVISMLRFFAADLSSKSYTRYLSALDGGNEKYIVGGSFGAFLNRRHGLQLFQYLINQCSDSSAGQSSYQCVDAAIRASGGNGFVDEFVRLYVSGKTPMSACEAPAGYGWPLAQSDKIVLPEFDAAKPYFTNAGQENPEYEPSPLEKFERTTAIRIADNAPKGATRYRRMGIMLPPGMSLAVVIH